MCALLHGAVCTQFDFIKVSCWSVARCFRSDGMLFLSRRKTHFWPHMRALGDCSGRLVWSHIARRLLSFFAADLCYRVQWQSGPEGTNDYLIRSCTEDLLVLSDPDANNGQGTRTSEASKTYCQQPSSNIAATHRSIVLDPSRLNTDPANIKATKSAKSGVQHLRVKSSWIVSI